MLSAPDVGELLGYGPCADAMRAARAAGRAGQLSEAAAGRGAGQWAEF